MALLASGLVMRLPFTATGWARSNDTATDPQVRKATLRGLRRSKQCVRQFHDDLVGPGLTLFGAAYEIGPVADDVTITAVPEPATLLLVSAGIVLVKRRRRSCIT